MASPYSSTYDYQGGYNNAVGGYNEAVQSTKDRAGELSTYRQNMANPADMYSNYLKQAQSSYGFDPAQLLKANQNLANTQTTLANLPQAAQQQGNYYGTTAGAMANNYQQQAGNLQALLSGQGNAVNAYRDVLGATQSQANQQTGFGVQGQQMNIDALGQLLNSALGHETSAQGMVTNARGQQADYGNYLNAQENARAAIMAAQAQQQAAAGSSAYNQQQAAQIAQQIALAQEVADKQRAASANVVRGNSIPLGSGYMQGNAQRVQ